MLRHHGVYLCMKIREQFSNKEEKEAAHTYFNGRDAWPMPPRSVSCVAAGHQEQ